jgi:hypothetical protein
MGAGVSGERSFIQVSRLVTKPQRVRVEQRGRFGQRCEIEVQQTEHERVVASVGDVIGRRLNRGSGAHCVGHGLQQQSRRARLIVRRADHQNGIMECYRKR